MLPNQKQFLQLLLAVSFLLLSTFAKTQSIYVPNPNAIAAFQAMLQAEQSEVEEDYPMQTEADQFPSDKMAYHNITTIFQRIQRFDKIMIRTNLDSLVINKHKGTYQNAFVTLSKEGEEALRMPIKLKARGIFRKQKCTIPPIKLNFSKAKLAQLGLYEKYDKLKLVTHCLDMPDSEQTLLKEYWTYRMYNELTTSSFKVHLLEINYIHETDPTRKISSYAIILESAKELAHRLDGKLVKGFGIKERQVSAQSFQDALLFNYMVGNTDWIVKTNKNVKFIQHKTSDKLSLIPYDFDFCKFVNPPYMRMDTDFGEIHPENRHARGTFPDKASLYDSIEKFKKLKKTGFKGYTKCKILKNKEKSYMNLFLQSFYQMLRKESKMEKTFLAAAYD